MLKVLIADDHPMFREALCEVVRQLAQARGDPCVCVEVRDSPELFATIARDDDFDLILLDLFMPGANGLADIARVREAAPGTPVVVISSLGDEATIHQAIICGAAGFVPKSATRPTLSRALGEVLAGGVYPGAAAPSSPPRRRAGARAADAEAAPLTARQAAVMALLANGGSNKAIANQLGISEMTVKAHMTAILRKLGVTTRAQAIVALQRAPGAERFTARVDAVGDQPDAGARSR